MTAQVEQPPGPRREPRLAPSTDIDSLTTTVVEAENDFQDRFQAIRLIE
jgi:hypothetical protein